LKKRNKSQCQKVQASHHRNQYLPSFLFHYLLIWV
jgi:hypothetical protein